jgi:hypothetical protein
MEGVVYEELFGYLSIGDVLNLENVLNSSVGLKKHLRNAPKHPDHVSFLMDAPQLGLRNGNIIPKQLFHLRHGGKPLVGMN